MFIKFNPTEQQCLLAARACMRTPAHIEAFNAFQPIPVTDIKMMAQFIRYCPGNLLSAVVGPNENELIGFIFCGSFFGHYLHRVPHIGFGLAMEYSGKGLGTQMVRKFILKMIEDELTNVIYGHCFEDNIGACKVMENAFMKGSNIGKLKNNAPQQVMEYRIGEDMKEWSNYASLIKAY